MQNTNSVIFLRVSASPRHRVVKMPWFPGIL
jgi:hypothetical protein